MGIGLKAAKYRAITCHLGELVSLLCEISENMQKLGDSINPLPHGTIYSSRIVMRLIPQVEGQNTRRFASWRFFDRTSYKPSSSPDEIVLHGRAPLSHVTPYRYFSNKMTPKDHLAAGPTAKVVVLKDLSNRTYPNLANLKLTFLETKK